MSVNYNHLFFKAYEEKTAIVAAKRLWLDALREFHPTVILSAVKVIIKEFDFLPTLSRVIRTCQSIAHNGLPDVRSAYLEACNAPSPKTAYRWSHPIVYFAGRDSDWFFLGNNPERVTYPVFKEHFEKRRLALLQGEKLPEIKQEALPESIETPLSKEENAQRLEDLKAMLEE